MENLFKSRENAGLFNISSNSKNQYISTGKQTFQITEDVLKNLNENLENKELKVKYAALKQYAITAKDNTEYGSDLRKIIDEALYGANIHSKHIQRQLKVVEKNFKYFKRYGQRYPDLGDLGLEDADFKNTLGTLHLDFRNTQFNIDFLNKAKKIIDNNELIKFLYGQDDEVLNAVFPDINIKEACEKSVEIKIVAESAIIDINSATFTANITQMTEKVGYKRSLFGISTGTIALLAVIAFFAVTNPISAPIAAVIIASAVSSLLVLALASYATYRSAQHCHKNYFITEILPKLPNCKSANSIQRHNTTAVTKVPLGQRIEATEQQTKPHQHGI